MLTHQDEQRIKQLIDDRIDPLDTKIDRIENNIDKILKIVTTDQQELTITKARTDIHHKRLTKLEHKLGLPSPINVALA